MQIMVVVTHLLGTGHLRRSINLAQAFVAEGHQVTLVSGGMPVSNFSTEGILFHQLPPVSSDGTNFVRLLKPDLSVADDVYLESRRRAITELVIQDRPAVIITELFPFGRRVLRAEFLELLNTAKTLPTRPIILSSVRDILAAPSSVDKAHQADAIVAAHYDAVLVHSDQSTVTLDKSWPVSAALSPMLHYTGYVSQSPLDNQQTATGGGEIVVTAGGGAVGGIVYQTAIEAARLLPDSRWRILVGGRNAADEVERLRGLGSGNNFIIETVRPDFRVLLGNALCSVSMCGYNTAVDLLQTGTPGVLIPFDEGGEREQTLRATGLSQTESYIHLLASDLTPENLCAAVTAVSKVGRYSADVQQFDGAAETVRFALSLAKEKGQESC